MTHLPPVISTAHEWENARGGDALERTAALGRDARDFARRNNLGHTPTDNWQGVASLGKESLRLLRYMHKVECSSLIKCLPCSDRPRNERGKELVTSAADQHASDDESDWETGEIFKYIQRHVMLTYYHRQQR
jgi:hypothetical protein